MIWSKCHFGMIWLYSPSYQDSIELYILPSNINSNRSCDIEGYHGHTSDSIVTILSSHFSQKPAYIYFIKLTDIGLRVPR